MLVHKTIVQILVIITAMAPLWSQAAGGAKAKAKDGEGHQQVADVKFKPEPGSWLDFDSKMNSPEMSWWQQQMDAIGLDIQLLFTHQAKCPAWFFSPTLYEMLKNFDYCATRWVWGHHQEIDSFGKWTVDIDDTRDLQGELELAVERYYDKNLPDMLSLFLHYIFSRDFEIDETSICFVNLWLLWINNEILPEGMAFNWRERYRELKAASLKWEKITGFSELVSSKTKYGIRDCVNKKFPSQSSEICEFLGAKKPDSSLGMVMIWDALLHSFYKNYRVEYQKDPLLGCYTQWLFKLFLSDKECSQPWHRTLAVAWRQWFMVECEAVHKKTKKSLPVSKAEWNWFHLLEDMLFPVVTDDDDPIPSHRFLKGGGDLSCLEEMDESDSGDEEEVVTEFVNTLDESDQWQVSKGSWLDHNTRLLPEERQRWKKRLSDAKIDNEDILFKRPNQECPKWFESRILYHLLYQFDRCARYWVIKCYQKSYVMGKWVTHETFKEEDNGESSVEMAMCRLYDNCFPDMLSFLLHLTLSKPYKVNDKTRAFTNIWLLWINQHILPEGVNFNWSTRYKELAEECKKWGHQDGVCDEALTMTDWLALEEYQQYKKITEINTKLRPKLGRVTSLEVRDNLRSQIKKFIRDNYSEWFDEIIGSLDCYSYDCSTGLRMATENMFHLCRAPERVRDQYAADPLLVDYQRGLFKIILCDPLNCEQKLRVIAVCLRQWFLSEFKFVVKKDLAGDRWDWYEKTLKFVFPMVEVGIGIDSKPIPWDIDSDDADLEAPELGVGELFKPSGSVRQRKRSHGRNNTAGERSSKQSKVEMVAEIDDGGGDRVLNRRRDQDDCTNKDFINQSGHKSPAPFIMFSREHVAKKRASSTDNGLVEAPKASDEVRVYGPNIPLYAISPSEEIQRQFSLHRDEEYSEDMEEQ